MLKDGYDPYDSYSTFIDASSPRPVDLVVLAESSLHEFEKDVRGEAAWKFAELLSAKTGGAAVLAGGQSITPSARGKHIQTAAALYTLPYSEFNSEPQVYIKRKLVPFGEYNPFAKVIPALRTASYFVETPGTEVGLFKLKRTRISPLICADILVPQYALESARAGAQLLVMISNNIWYTPSSWPLQHGWQTIARAVETGLPLITAGNVGLTGVVSPNGTATWLCDSTTGRPLMNDAGLLYKTIHLPLIPTKTLYTQFGDMPLLTLSLFGSSAGGFGAFPAIEPIMLISSGFDISRPIISERASDEGALLSFSTSELATIRPRSTSTAKRQAYTLAATFPSPLI